MFDFVLGDLLLIDQVGFVADEEEDGIFLSVGLDLVHPEFDDVVEAEGVSEVKDQKDALAAPIVRASDGSEPFLASRIPDLEFDIFGINLDGLEPEIDSDCGQVML